ncbi:MAG: phosphodiester glycosidase family protein [Christensenellaceae bacterium]|nr:phosphodiester glycosidase family protein [Christensenellaceae bacterium]
MKFKSNKQKIFVTVVADALLFAVALLTFAYFHHVKPRKIGDSVALATPIPLATPSPAPTAAPTPLSTDTVIDTSKPTEKPTPEPTPEPTGLLKGKFADKFTDGEIISDENGYRSKNVCVELSRVEIKVGGMPVVYCLADVYIQDISCFRTEMAQTSNNKERVEAMAQRTNAIVAVSGDYWMFKETGLVIRNGALYRDTLRSGQDVCVLFYDGTVKTYLARQFTLAEIYANYPLHAWSFGPRLLDNGQPITDREAFNTSDYIFDWHPRCAFGYYEPGHYCFVIVEGRQEGYSYGLNMTDLSQLMYDLGCTEAFNLDGGMTAMMAYKGELYSQPCGGGRPNCDILYIAEPLDANETNE